MGTLGAIACVAKNGTIGRNGLLPWHIREDLEHFKALTMGHALIMGRKTFESLPCGLMGRKLVILSSQPRVPSPADNVFWAASKEDALALAFSLDENPIVAGGEKIYRLFSDDISRLWLTRLNEEYSGDAFFPLEILKGGLALAKSEAFSQGRFEYWEKP